MARVKKVFQTNEIAHLWAHKTQEDARNAQGNFYFDGDTIYSYGSHFPIARHVKNGKGESAVLLTNRTWSNTTGGHVNLVRRSIPHGVPVFEVHDPTRDVKGEYQAQRADVEARIKKLQAARPDNRYEYKVKTEKIKFNARTENEEVDAIAGKNVVAFQNATYCAPDNWTLAVRNGPNAGVPFEPRLSKAEARIMLDILDSIKTWDVSTKEKRERLLKKVAKARMVAAQFASISRNPGTLTNLYYEVQTKTGDVNKLGAFFGYGPIVEIPADLRYLDAISEAHNSSVERARVSAHDRRMARWAKRDEDSRKSFEEKLPLWLAGEHVSLGYHNTAYLRVKDNEVETSQGARVPLEHVKKALPLVMAYVRNGREYHRNGHTIHLGHYAIDSIDAEGNLRAGCHLFSKAEIERFAGVLEALPVDPEVPVPVPPAVQTEGEGATI
jgi:hypothetical protein